MFQFKAVRSFAPLLLTVLLLSCGDDKKANKEQALPQGMVMADLSAYGKPFTVPVPDTTASPLTITEEQDGALSLRSGRSFGMSIYEQEADLKLKKDDIQADEVNRLKRMVREDKDGLIWESAITEPEHHFVCNRRLAGGSYSFSDIPGTSFSEDAVKTMFESAMQATEKTP
jgi:hypothetical protein